MRPETSRTGILEGRLGSYRRNTASLRGYFSTATGPAALRNALHLEYLFGCRLTREPDLWLQNENQAKAQSAF